MSGKATSIHYPRVPCWKARIQNSREPRIIEIARPPQALRHTEAQSAGESSSSTDGGFISKIGEGLKFLVTFQWFPWPAKSES